MLKNNKLAKSISDVAWNSFINKLKYKLKEQGKYFIKVDKWFESSKILVVVDISYMN